MFMLEIAPPEFPHSSRRHPGRDGKRQTALPLRAGLMITDPIAFIRAETRLRPVPHARRSRLWRTRRRSSGRRPRRSWARSAWPLPSGLSPGPAGRLSRYILDHPETVRGRRVLVRLRFGPRRHRGQEGRRRRGDHRYRPLRHRGHRRQCRGERGVRHVAEGRSHRKVGAGTRCSPATSATSAILPPALPTGCLP